MPLPPKPEEGKRRIEKEGKEGETRGGEEKNRERGKRGRILNSHIVIL